MLRWVSYILAIIVSVQAYAAMTDVYHSHQSQEESLETKHQHQDAVEKTSQISSSNSSSSNDVTNAFDCHHCCHCHSCHTHILIRESFPSAQSLSYNSNPRGNVNSAQIGILSQPYRPPRV